MPNWCENELTVTGLTKDLKKFVKKARSTDAGGKDQVLTLHAFVPMPREYTENKDPRDDRWYGWALQNWGTKWDIEATMDGSAEDGRVTYRFDTAWSPPLEWLEKVVRTYPALSFELRYAEPGGDFAGVVEGSEGTLDAPQEMRYDEAQVQWHGEIRYSCDCGEDVVSTVVLKNPICDTCYIAGCRNCGDREQAHVNGKCVFDATTFAPRRIENGVRLDPVKEEE